MPSTPSRLAFTRNPIIIESSHTSGDQPLTGYPFSIIMDGLTLYNGRFNYPYSINVADIVNAYIKYLPQPDEVEPISFGPLILIENESEVLCRDVAVVFNGEYDQEFAFIALPGGVSKQNFKRLGPSTDIFNVRFLASDTNCFLTTRTAGWRVIMKESELYPL